jgi:hypothetical protein
MEGAAQGYMREFALRARYRQPKSLDFGERDAAVDQTTQRHGVCLIDARPVYQMSGSRSRRQAFVPAVRHEIRLMQFRRSKCALP